jgi:lipopolysaccharide export system protein LptA
VNDAAGKKHRIPPIGRGTWWLVVGAVLIVFPATRLRADTFQFSGDRTEIVLAEGRERTVLRGNALVVSNAFTLRANEIELYGPDFRYAAMRGAVHVLDSARDMSITAGTLWFDRHTENSRAEADVMVEDRENDLIVRAGYLETREGGDLLFAQISVRVLQDDLTARAQFLRYRRADSGIELSGFPVVYWKGDRYRATRIVLNLDTEEIELLGRVEGTVVLEEEEEDGEENGDGENDES